MALINCKNCNSRISDKAEACPKCGTQVTAEETFKCFECNIELPAGTKICSNCGAEQESILEFENNSHAVKEEQKETSTVIVQGSKTVSKRKILIWILSGVACLILVGGGLLITRHQSTGERAANGQRDSINFADSIARLSRMGDSIRAVESSPSAPSSANSYSVPQPKRQKTTDELRQELLGKEKQRPLDYLSITYNLDVEIHLLKESKDIIRGTIYNSATIATFKDVSLKISFSTNTNSLLSTKRYTVYEYVQANGSTNFMIKLVSPPGTKKIGVEIVSAKPD